MPRTPRRIFLVNGKVQGNMLARVAIYWGYFFVASFMAAMGWLWLFDRPQSWGELAGQMLYQAAPMLLATLLLLPFLLMDGVRFTNRFVGPLFRLTRAMDRLADAEQVHNIEFREGDFWFHIAQTFNRLNERTIRLEQQVKAGERQNEEAMAEVP